MVLITSHGTHRWVITRDWPMKGRTAAEAAEVEASEEARRPRKRAYADAPPKSG